MVSCNSTLRTMSRTDLQFLPCWVSGLVSFIAWNAYVVVFSFGHQFFKSEPLIAFFPQISFWSVPDLFISLFNSLMRANVTDCGIYAPHHTMINGALNDSVGLSTNGSTYIYWFRQIFKCLQLGVKHTCWHLNGHKFHKVVWQRSTFLYVSRADMGAIFSFHDWPSFLWQKYFAPNIVRTCY